MADGGDEVRLTNAKGVDDGPESTPDGRWIFFNSSRTGRMQIWKMRPDGTEQQQITGDEFNNWFPHIAPDGKSMVVVSFLSDVDPADHPFYRQVYIRQMDLEGAGAKVLAYAQRGPGDDERAVVVARRQVDRVREQYGASGAALGILQRRPSGLPREQ